MKNEPPNMAERIIYGKKYETGNVGSGLQFRKD